jgi:hypothetical protein
MTVLTKEERNELGLVTLNEIKENGNDVKWQEWNVLFANNGRTISVHEHIMDDLYITLFEVDIPKPKRIDE